MPTCSVLPAGNMRKEDETWKVTKCRPDRNMPQGFKKKKRNFLTQIDIYLAKSKKFYQYWNLVSVPKGLVTEATYIPIKYF